MKEIGEPTFQFIGNEGEFHLLKISYPYWQWNEEATDDGQQYRQFIGTKGVTLKIRAEDLWDIPAGCESPKFTLKDIIPQSIRDGWSSKTK